MCMNQWAASHLYVFKRGSHINQSCWFRMQLWIAASMIMRFFFLHCQCHVLFYFFRLSNVSCTASDLTQALHLRTLMWIRSSISNTIQPTTQRDTKLCRAIGKGASTSNPEDSGCTTQSFIMLSLCSAVVRSWNTIYIVQGTRREWVNEFHMKVWTLVGPLSHASQVDVRLWIIYHYLVGIILLKY